jgi:aminoglycoside phosphotransferase family enzyme
MPDGAPCIGPAHGCTVAFLSRGESYPECPAEVTVIATHFSWVFLTDTRAYKLKKPVRGDGFDFRTIEARRRNAVAEVRLNRRLAPDVYLGVVPVVLAPEGGLAIGGAGTPVDWLVEMVRLDAERSLVRLLSRHRVGHAEIEALASRLAGFFATAARAIIPLPLFNRRMERELRDTLVIFRALRQVALLNAASRSVRRLRSFSRRRCALLRERIQDRLTIDGHGDLRPEHIYLNGGARVIDCLEFRADLRKLDPLNEIAYLALECRRLGSGMIGSRLIRRYRERTGDDAPVELLHFYASLNALIRARISIQHLAEPGARPPAQWVSRAAEYLDIAEKASRRLAR